jgi:DNA-binding CsgD family transcriptional regulator
MGIRVKTLENHMAHIFDKLSVASRHELTALAYEEGYLRPDDH